MSDVEKIISRLIDEKAISGEEAILLIRSVKNTEAGQFQPKMEDLKASTPFIGGPLVYTSTYPMTNTRTPYTD